MSDRKAAGLPNFGSRAASFSQRVKQPRSVVLVFIGDGAVGVAHGCVLCQRAIGEKDKVVAGELDVALAVCVSHGEPADDRVIAVLDEVHVNGGSTPFGPPSASYAPLRAPRPIDHVCRRFEGRGCVCRYRPGGGVHSGHH